MTRNLRIAIWVAVAVGIVLRVAHYFRRGSLWLDEAMLAVSIVTRPPSRLFFTPLEYSQVAPPGFLQALKLSTIILGPSELALRLVPLVASLLALMMFVRLARETLLKWEMFFAIAAFAMAPMVLTYSADAKQYTGDLAAALALTLAILHMRSTRYSRRWIVMAAGGGAAVVWFSDASALVMTGLGLALAALAVLERDRLAMRAATIIAPAWILAIVAHQRTVDWRTVGNTSRVMHKFWTEFHAFMPFPPKSAEDVFWLPTTIGQAYREGLGLRGFRGACLILGSLGLIALWRRGRRDVVLLLGLPVLVTLIASASKAYPFADRLILFLLPALAVAAAAGAGFVTKPWPRVQPVLLCTMFLLLLATPRYTLTAAGPPWRRQEMRPVLATLAAHRRPGDRIYVFHWAVPAVDFYQRQYGLTRRDWTSGRGHTEVDKIAEDVEALRGSRRVWIILSYDRPYGRHQKILDMLETIGSRIPTEGYPAPNVPRGDTSLHLFELGTDAEPGFGASALIRTGSR